MHGPYEVYDLGGFVLKGSPTHLTGVQVRVHDVRGAERAKDKTNLAMMWCSGRHRSWAVVYINPDHTLNSDKCFIGVINLPRKRVLPVTYLRSRNSMQCSYIA